MAYGMLVSSVMSQLINSWPNKKLLNYKYSEQIKDILASIALALLMGIGVYFVGYLHLPYIIKLLLQIGVGVLIYVGGSALFKFEEFEYIRGVMIKRKSVIDSSESRK